MIRLVAGLLAMLVVGPALAQGVPSGTLDKIIQRKVLRVAFQSASPPFGFTNAQGQPDGIDAEVARLMAKDLGVELELVQVNAPGRIPSLMTDRADVVISVFGITPERAKQVSFSIPYAAVKLIVYGPKSEAVKSVADLKGKRVGLPRGTVQDLELSRVAPDATMVRFEDDATVTAAMLAKQVDVIGTSNAVMLGMAERYPDLGLSEKFAIGLLPIAIGMRRGDPDFLQWVNTFVYHRRMTGELGQIYQKYLKDTLPELGSF
jgi:polar amino acid transport system substrate-binding protein